MWAIFTLCMGCKAGVGGGVATAVKLALPELGLQPAS